MSGTKIGVGFGLWRLGMPSPDTICSYAERAEALVELQKNVAADLSKIEKSEILSYFSAS